jgi:putative FmdB family regulatory protein
MPTYTYRCNKCGTEYEVFQSMSDAPLKRCKKCRGALRRTFHPVGIVLKGPGFHKTDNRSKSYSGGEKKEASDKADSDKSDKAEKADKAEKTPKTEKTKKKDASKSESKPSKSGSAPSSDG